MMIKKQTDGESSKMSHLSKKLWEILILVK